MATMLRLYEEVDQYEVVLDWMAEHEDEIAPAASVIIPKRSAKPNPVKEKAMDMFAQGCRLDEVATETGRALSVQPFVQYA